MQLLLVVSDVCIVLTNVYSVIILVCGVYPSTITQLPYYIAHVYYVCG